MSFVLPVQCTALGLMIVLSIVGNMGVCWVTYNTRNSEPITAMLMMNMAATDLLRGVIDMPFAFITLVSGYVDEWLLGDTVCQLTAFASQTLCLASTLSVACVSIDRYCTIVYAFDYQRMMTQRRAKMMLVLTWLAAAATSALPVLGVGLYRFLPAAHHCTTDWTHSPAYSVSVLTAGFLLPLLVMSVCNFRIFRTARSQSRRVDELSSRGGDGARSADWLHHRRARRAWRPPRHRQRAAKIILVVFGTFFCCWTVYSAAHVWIVVRYQREVGVAWSEQRAPPRDPYDLSCWLGTLATFVAFANAVISPYVYTLLNRRMRKTLRKLLIRLCWPVGRVDYRRSTIVFATNVDRWRSARQGDLLEARRSDSESSRYLREDAESFRNIPLRWMNHGDSSYNASCSATSPSPPPTRRRGPVPQVTFNLEHRSPQVQAPVRSGTTLPPDWCCAVRTAQALGHPEDQGGNQGRCSPQSNAEEEGASTSHPLRVVREADEQCTADPKWPRDTGCLRTPLGTILSSQSPGSAFALPDCSLMLGARLTTKRMKSLGARSRASTNFQTATLLQAHPGPQKGKASQRGKAKNKKIQAGQEAVLLGTLKHTARREKSKVRFKEPAESINDASPSPDAHARKTETRRARGRRVFASDTAATRHPGRGAFCDKEIPEQQ